MSGKYGRNPFEPLQETAAQISNGYDPERAKTVLACMHHVPDMFEAVGQMLDQLGQKNVEGLDLGPASSEVCNTLGSYIKQLIDPVRDAVSTIEREHAPEIARILEPTPNAAKWDVAANAD